MEDKPPGTRRIRRRGVLAGLAGVGVAATGLLPSRARGESETALLGDFESGLDGWRTVGESLLDTVSAAEYPGAVTRGRRGLQVTAAGDLLPTIWNEQRVRSADFAGHPYFVADVTPGLFAGTDSPLTFELRYVHGDVPLEATVGEVGLGALPGVHESEAITVPPLAPSRLYWDMSDLPDAALSNPRRLEVLWYPADAAPEASDGSLDVDLGGLLSGVDSLGSVVFDDLRLSDRVETVSTARLSNAWRDLQLEHGAYLETVVASRTASREEGAFVFADGASVPYAFEVLGEGSFRYEVDGEVVASGGGVVADTSAGSGGSGGTGGDDVRRPTRPSTAGRNEASAAVLTYIPGTSENTGEGGDEYDSAMPDVSDHVDNAFHADNRTSLESTLAEATELDKRLAEYPDRLFPHYRVRNGVSVSFSSPDGERIDGAVTVSAGEESALSPVTLEGEAGEGGDNPYRANLDSIHGGEEYKAPLAREHHVSHATFEVEGVEGVRASTIYGGVDSYIAEYVDAIAESGLGWLDATPAGAPAAYVLDHLLALPAFYSFLEVTLLADGTRVARVWDAGQYPRHALYLDGGLLGESDFDLGEEWWKNEQMNAFFARWGTESKLALHPYKSPHLAYEKLFGAGGGPHPVLLGGEDGETLTVEDVVGATPTPHFPF